MALVCPRCGKLSGDISTCEHCRADLGSLPSAPESCPLPSGPVLLVEEDRRALHEPESYLLLPGDPAGAEPWWRVHWLEDAAADDWRQSGSDRERLRIPGISRVRSVIVSEGIWVFAPAAGRIPWFATRVGSAMERLERVLLAAQELGDLLENLHARGVFWMNFTPTELERDLSDRLRIINLDLRVFPIGQAPNRLAIDPAYAVPEVVYLKGADLGPRTDVHHLSVFSYYALAGRYPHGVAGDGMEAVDFRLPPLRIYAPDLPEGVQTVLDRGMAPEPHHRYATPRQFVRHLRGALENALRRRSFAGPVAWDIGSDCRAGRSKKALFRANEDHVVVRRIEQPGRPPHAFLAVADGITSCDIGSGAIASRIAGIVIENAIDRIADSGEFRAGIGAICRRSSQALIDWAIEKGYRNELRLGRDLMGSTLTAAWLEENRFTIANLGDSRAYLIEGTRVEQLTVDGDLASDLLQQGMPPEQVRELGLMTRALRRCIGGCELDAKGEPTIVADSSEPSLTEWRLLPGDVVVLCSDGLVEEGAFLEPELLVEIVRNHPKASAQQLAILFADAADSLQRVPSDQEPEGFGDNISCIVVKISAG
ncbi:MAG TPA: protein phosphatase 2C domain-containing protein [Gemmataceae bacterium]|jgi:serine/threonine protein phosphatase PrpC|nr:protein phosphatase 2C domain-containing protein [Gemmataceae bacterium]